MILGKASHQRPHYSRQGLTPKTAWSWARHHIRDYMILGKTSHLRLYEPRQGITPSQHDSRQCFTPRPHDPRQGLTLKPKGFLSGKASPSSPQGLGKASCPSRDHQILRNVLYPCPQGPRQCGPINHISYIYRQVIASNPAKSQGLTLETAVSQTSPHTRARSVL